MAAARTVLLTASSEKDFEDAIRRGLEAAHSRHRDIRGVWITRRSSAQDGGGTPTYHVTMTVAFLDPGAKGPSPDA